MIEILIIITIILIILVIILLLVIISKDRKIIKLETILEERANTDILKKEFQELADDIFSTSTQDMREQNSDSLGVVLSPIKEQLNQFKARVEDIYSKNLQDKIKLEYEIKTLKELNYQISQDAINLTNALKGDNKTQGNWGEMILERVLENSGLRANQEYFREVSLKNSENKTYRPDVIVKLPNKKDVIIDAKTSLKDYEKFISQDRDISPHIKSIKNHIKSLSDKNYEKLKGINSLDFILMFIPISNALIVAIQNDTTLFEEAFKQKVILVTPETLLISLKTIENSWRFERQAKNAIEVVNLAEKLYSKVRGFSQDLDKIGLSLNKTQEHYDNAYNKLYNSKDSIITQIEHFREKADITPKQRIKK